MQFFKWHTIGLGLLACAAAQAAEPLTNTLSVHRIERNGAVEAAAPATAAKPGDVLEYVAELHNGGASTVRGVTATLPLPAGTELIATSHRPSAVTASLDGITFAAIPLTRNVKQADGSLREERVPYTEYRFLRWPATDLDAGGAFSVSARVTISSSTDKPRLAAQ